MKKRLKKAVELACRAEEYLKSYQFSRVFEAVTSLKKELEKILEEVENKEKKKASLPPVIESQARHFLGWYLRLWNNEPPESFSTPSYRGMIYRIARKLVEVYVNKGESVEELKGDYEKFLERCKLEKKKVSFRGLISFCRSLPDLKAGLEEWGEVRGKDVYLSVFEKKFYDG